MIGSMKARLFAAAVLLMATSVLDIALAGKQPKYDAFRSSYAAVTSQIKGDQSKLSKARAIMASVRGAMDSMDREAFYVFVAKKEAELWALAK